MVREMSLVKPLSSAFIAIVVCLLSAALGDSASKGQCVYTVYVKTGSIIKAGTDSKISITLGDQSGHELYVSDLEAWGLMGSSYDYYERANLDIFSIRGECLGTPLCRLNLTSDGSGAHHGWYCDYLEVTATGPHKQCSQTTFYVGQWLATDAPPYELTTILDGCGQESQVGPLVLRNPVKAWE